MWPDLTVTPCICIGRILKTLLSINFIPWNLYSWITFWCKHLPHKARKQEGTTATYCEFPSEQHIHFFGLTVPLTIGLLPQQCLRQSWTVVYLKFLGLEHMEKVINGNYSIPMETSWPQWSCGSEATGQSNCFDGTCHLLKNYDKFLNANGEFFGSH